MKSNEDFQILRAEETPWRGNPHFRIRVIQPERALGESVGPIMPPQLSGERGGFGPLQLVMHCYLKDIHIPMHEHRNDEIMSYLYTGEMHHKDSVGQTATVSASTIMMMNAGKSFYHEETSEACEALQILIRPEEPDLESGVQFYEREVAFSNGWNLLAGPKEMNAPLVIRNHVAIFDARLHAGEVVNLPQIEGMSPWLFVMDGGIKVDQTHLTKGDAIAGDAIRQVNLEIVEDATLVLFLSDVTV